MRQKDTSCTNLRCSTSDRNRCGTDVDASAWLLLAINQVLHPVDVVEAEGDGGYEALQRDLDGQTKVLLQQGAGQRSHRLWLLEIHSGHETKNVNISILKYQTVIWFKSFRKINLTRSL